jgi:hypothetical protein
VTKGLGPASPRRPPAIPQGGQGQPPRAQASPPGSPKTTHPPTHPPHPPTRHSAASCPRSIWRRACAWPPVPSSPPRSDTPAALSPAPARTARAAATAVSARSSGGSQQSASAHSSKSGLRAALVRRSACEVCRQAAGGGYGLGGMPRQELNTSAIASFLQDNWK